jgi:hypothetical protein
VAINLMHIPEGQWMDALDLPARLAGRPGWLPRVMEALGDSPRAHPTVSVAFGLLVFLGLAIHLGRVALRTPEAPKPGSG